MGGSVKIGSLGQKRVGANTLGKEAKLLMGFAKPVEKYEVGAFRDLEKRSVRGDGLDIHHVVQSNPGGQVIAQYDRLSAPSIALLAGEHRLIPTIKGPYDESARSLLAKDISDLRNFTNAPNSSLRQLIELNKQTYPMIFVK